MNRFYTPITFVIVLIIIVSCAKIGAPPGGPKDEDPPVVIKSSPANYATEYKRRNVVIKFDEFVTLKNAFSEFTISPPLEDNPIPYTRGKSIVVDLPAVFLDSFTYTMDFGQSIADNNEGNKLPDFQFVVSKMAHIDSFSVTGKVLDAFTLKPDEEGLFVYLNRNLNDTVPYTTIPSYLGRTDPEGAFQINHIASGTYSVFVLKDANANLIYDMPSEVIGFSNELVYLYPDSFKVEVDTLAEMALSDSTITDSLPILLPTAEKVAIDTNMADTVSNTAEPLVSEFSTEGDSLYIEPVDSANFLAEMADSSVSDSIEFMVYGYSINLFSFTEKEPYNQYLLEYNRTRPDRIDLIFNAEADSLPRLELLNPDNLENWYMLEENPTFDTLAYWLPDSSLIKNDSIVLIVHHTETDTLGELVPAADTLLFRSKIIEKGTSRRKERSFGLLGKKDEVVDTLPVKPPRVNVTNNINKSAHDLYKPIILTPEIPTLVYNESLIELSRMEDTVEVVTDFTFQVDSSSLRRSIIKIDFESNTTYILRLHEGVLFDIHGRTIDSTEITFQTQDEEHYGVVELKTTGINHPTIVQLLNKNEELVKQKIVSANADIVFNFLNPGEYMLKAIIDENNNGEWDTGILDLKQQPERVKYFPDMLNVRSNWTIDYEWEIEEPAEENIVEDNSELDNDDSTDKNQDENIEESATPDNIQQD